MQTPSNAWMRSRSPSTTLMLTRTVSPDWNAGTGRAAISLAICSASRVCNRFMSDLPSAAGSFRLRGAIAFPQIGAALPGQQLRLGPAPGADPSMIARYQRVGHGAAVPHGRPRVMRIFEQPLGEALRRERLGRAADAGQQRRGGVDGGDRRRHAAGQNEMAEADLLDLVSLQPPPVDAPEPAADEPRARAVR